MASDSRVKEFSTRIFNESYLQTRYKTLYVPDIKKPTGFLFSGTDSQSVEKKTYIDEVLDFMLTSNVHESLGITFLELMNMDVGIYDKIKKAIIDHRPKESDQALQLKKELEKGFKK